MAQGVLAFKYDVEPRSVGVTSRGGAPVYLDLAAALGMMEAIDETVKVRQKGQGWTDRQMLMTLLILNLVGGECVDDVDHLNADDGLSRLLLKVENYGLNRKSRRLAEKRWRKKRTRTIPSPSAVRRYLLQFHSPEEEEKRLPGAFIPAKNEHLRSLDCLNSFLLSAIQSRSQETKATLDVDATVVASSKCEAIKCYKGFKAYQPLNVYWFEQELIVASEFRDGNVPASVGVQRVFLEALERLPEPVKRVSYRSDSAGYIVELLKFCAEGRSERFGVIDFAVSVDMLPPFRKAISEVPETSWKPLRKKLANGRCLPSRMEWAEVVYVPDWAGQKKDGPNYRFLAVREYLDGQQELPGMESQLRLPFPTMRFSKGSTVYGLRGVVTNRLDLPGDEVIWWNRERNGKSEAAHDIMKRDLAGGTLPSGYFGVNAAWWAIMILAFNLNSALKRLALPKAWSSKRMKALRFGLINLAGRVVQRARGLIIRITASGETLQLLLGVRARISTLANPPPNAN